MLENKFIYIPSVSVGSYGVACMSNKRFRDGLPLRYYDTTMDESLYYPYFLVTAGHFYKKENYRAILGATDSTILFGDSGGFQIATGAIKFEQEILDKIFVWLEDNCDVSVVLDIPPRMKLAGKFDECLDISYNNFKYFEKNQTGKTKFLNVLQGSDLNSYKIWFNRVKDMNFNGWCLANLVSFKNIIESLSILIDNKELQKKETKYIHLLGVSKIFDFFLMTTIQNTFNKLGYDTQITSDSSSPTNSMRFGGFYIQADFKTGAFRNIHIPHRSDFEGKMNENELLPVLNSADVYLNKCFDYEDLKECTNRFNSVLSLHNISIFLDTAKTISNLVSHPYLLEQMVNKETYQAMILIEKMIIQSENGSSAIKFVNDNNYIITQISSRLAKAEEFLENTFF